MNVRQTQVCRYKHQRAYTAQTNLQLAIQHVETGINLDTFRRHIMNKHWKGNNDICCAMCYGVAQSKNIPIKINFKF
jgi:hypothetical protein